MVVVAQSYYPNWHAFVNNWPARLWRANYAFQALEVAAGRHEVTLVYEDKLFHWGVIISILVLGICGFLLLRRNIRLGKIKPQRFSECADGSHTI